MIGTQPYFDDCRWKTQNLRVHRQPVRGHPSHIPQCTADGRLRLPGPVLQLRHLPGLVAVQGVRRAERTSPSTRTTGGSDNTYVGPWRFEACTLGQHGVVATVAAATYGQDARQHARLTAAVKRPTSAGSSRRQRRRPPGATVRPPLGVSSRHSAQGLTPLRYRLSSAVRSLSVSIGAQKPG